VRYAKTVVVVLAVCAVGAGGGVAAAAAKPRPAGPVAARLSAPLRSKTAQGGGGPRADGTSAVDSPGYDMPDGANSQPMFVDSSRGHQKGRDEQDRVGTDPAATLKTTMTVASTPTTVVLPSDYWY
jgi:hypothetical protein